MVFDSITYEISGKTILQGVFLKLQPRQIVGVFGINGSGKSTLIKIGAGLLSPSFGSVFIKGENYSFKPHIDRYNFIAYLSQESFLPNDVKVSKVLNWHAYAGSDPFIHKYQDRLINTLSGGERKYLELFLLLLLNRQYILLDEPFTGIEPKYIEMMTDLIAKQKARGAGILITDHYYRYVAGLIDKGYYLNNGNCKEMKLENGVIKSLIEEGYINAG